MPLKTILYGNEVEEMVETMSHAIMAAAKNSIPITKGLLREKNVPWWNEELAKAIKDKKRTFNKFKKHPTIENMIEFKRCRAVASLKQVQSQKQSWHDYVSSITPSTPQSEIWQRIRCIIGKRFQPISPIITVNDTDITHPPDIATTLRITFMISVRLKIIPSDSFN